MANNTWSNYTEKTATPVDADEVMVRDSTDGKNKRLIFGTFWKWVAKKLNEATISELETDNKTIIGAINALHSDSKSLIIKKFIISDTASTVHIRPDKTISHFSFLAFGENNNKIFYAFGAKNSNYCYGCTVTAVSENNEFTFPLSVWSSGVVISIDQFTVLL